MSLDNLTKKFFDMATPKKLREWIEILSKDLKDKNFKIKQLEAEVRKLKGLP